MRLPARLFPIIGCCLVATPAPAAEGEPDQYEEKTVARAVERAVRAAKSDRVAWVKELEDAFPGRVPQPVKEEEYGAWFTLLAGTADDWRKDSAPNPRIAELFDRVVQRLELGPVPSVKRDEFLRYARRVLVQGNSGSSGNDPHEDADRAFRVLDRDGDAGLSPGEMPAKLRDDRLRADADGNGRVDKDEYRAYFHRRVEAGADAAIKAADQNGRGNDPKTAARPGAAANGLPDWFTTLDADKDGQIALHEWRRGGRPVDDYLGMDLNGDGLLTRDEYLRFVRQNEARVKEEPVPPGKVATMKK